MRLLVCGGRAYDDARRAFGELDRAHDEQPISALIHGDATGADTLGRLWATAKGVPVEAYAADWKKHGKAAGPRRNAEMLERGRPDLVAALP